MGGIIAQVKPMVLNALNSLVFSDEAINVSVTYKQYTGSAYDPTQGRNVPSFTEHPDIDALELAHSKVSAVRAGSKVVEGQKVFVFRADDLRFELSTNDVVVCGGKEYFVVIGQPIYGILHSVTVKTV